MSAGHQAAYDQIVALVANTAGLTSDGKTSAFTQQPYRLDLADAEETNVHRRYHVLVDGCEPFTGDGGSMSGSVTDSFLLCSVQVGYHEGGGDATSHASRQGVDRLALDDLNRLRQHLTHPDNRDHTNTGIVRVDWVRTTTREREPGSHRRIYDMALRVWVRHAVLS